MISSDLGHSEVSFYRMAQIGRVLLVSVIFLLTYFALYFAVPIFEGQDGPGWFPSPWFPPAGLAVAILILYGWRAFPLVVLGRFLTDLTAYGAEPAVPVYSLVIPALYTAAAEGIRRSCPDGDIYSMRSRVVAFLSFGAVASVLAAACGTGIHELLTEDSSPSCLVAGTYWAIGDLMGIVTITPVVLMLARLAGLKPAGQESGLNTHSLSGRRTAGLAGFSILLVSIITTSVFLPSELRLVSYVLALVPLMGAALWLYWFGAVVSVVLLNTGTLLSIALTGPNAQSIVPVQVLLLTQSCTALFLGALSGERSRALTALRNERANLKTKVKARTEELSKAATVLEAKRLEVERHERSLAAIVECVPDLIIRQKGDGVFLEIIVASDSDMTKSTDELVGRHPSQTGIPQSLIDRSTAVIAEVIRSGNIQTYEYELDVKSGREIFEARVVRSGPDEVISFIRNVSERKRQEREIRDALTAAEVASQSRARFLAMISHELRTPLTAILGIAEMMEEATPRANQRAQLSTIVRAGRTLLSQINQILDFSRFEQKGIEVSPTEFDPVTLMEDALDLAQGIAVERQIRLIGLSSASVPTTVVADEEKLRQVLLNLVGNAAKFSDPGEVLVRLSRISDDVSVPRLRFSVSDRGPGMAEEDLKTIFEPFARARGVEGGRQLGTGLGLAICRQLVEAMGGSIHATSSPASGSEFSFSVPILSEKTGGSASNPDVTCRSGVVWAVGFQEGEIEYWKHCTSDLAETVVLFDSIEEARNAFNSGTSTGECPEFVFVELARLLEYEGLPPWNSNAFAVVTDYSSWRNTPVVDAPVITRPLTRRKIRSILFPVGKNGNFAPILQEPPKGDAGGDRVPNGIESDKSLVRFLIVEDSGTIRTLLLHMLRREGFTTLETTDDGQDAIRLLSQSAYDALIVDQNLPGKKGHEIVGWLRNRENGGHRMYVMGLTASADPGDLAALTNAGVDVLLSKPVDLAGFRKALTGIERRA